MYISSDSIHIFVFIYSISFVHKSMHCYLDTLHCQCILSFILRLIKLFSLLDCCHHQLFIFFIKFIWHPSLSDTPVKNVKPICHISDILNSGHMVYEDVFSMVCEMIKLVSGHRQTHSKYRALAIFMSWPSIILNHLLLLWKLQTSVIPHPK